MKIVTLSFFLFLVTAVLTVPRNAAAAPAVASFALPTSARSLTVPVVRFTAWDTAAVTGYLITDSPLQPLPTDLRWQLTPPAAVTVTAAGTWPLYAWVKNGAAQVSSPLSGSVTVGPTLPLTRVALAAGALHSVAVKGDGSVIAWGNSSFGQSSVPATLNGVVALAAAGYHTIALKNDGTIHEWGSISLNAVMTPLSGVLPPAGVSGAAAAVAAGTNHSIALKNDGTVAAWGDNSQGQALVPAGLAGVVAIAASGNHSMALKQDGAVVEWGLVTGAALTPLPLLGKVVAITAGLNHSVALLSTGAVAAWGDNSLGQLNVPVGLSGVVAVSASGYHTVALKGDGTIVEWGAALTPAAPAGLSGVIAIVAGQAHALALKGDGSVVAWGVNSSLQAAPPPAAPLLALSAANSHFLGLTSNGSVASWGADTNGQVSLLPAGLTGISTIADGLAHSAALKSDGSVLLWGSNSNFQLSRQPAGLLAKGIAAGSTHTLALNPDGTVTGWGECLSGECTPPTGLSNVVALSAGNFVSVALKSDGTVVAWGANAIPQLGKPPLVTNAAAVPAGLSGVVSISSFGSHTVALKSDGTVVTWGSIFLKNVTSIPVTESVPAGLTGVVAVAAGANFALALKGDGTLVAWGDNSRNQLTIPSGLTGVVAIAAGVTSAVAVKGDGSIVIWGDGAFGESALPVTAPDSTPPALYRFTLPSTVATPAVMVTSILASDIVGVTGYLVTESAAIPTATDPGWTAIPPPYVTAGGGGVRTFSGWTKDAAGNVSAPLSTPVTVLASLVSTSAGVGGTISPALQWVLPGGAAQLFVITPDPGFSLNVVSGCGGTLSGTLYTTGTVTADCTVTATFFHPLTMVTIDTMPPNPSAGTPAAFTFSSVTTPAATFMCSIDGAAFSPCTAPQGYSGLAAGNHVFRVYALDSLGSPGIIAQYQWTVAATAAAVTLTGLNQGYDGGVKVVTASTTPAGLAVSVTYNGGASAPTMAGTYSVIATVTDPNYSGSVTGSLTITKGTPVVTWPVPSAVYQGTTLSATQLNATASVPGSFVYSPVSGTLLTTVGAQALSVTFTPTDAANYVAATAGVSLTVTAKLVPVIVWAAPSSITYGTPLSVTQLNATSNIPGSFVYAPAAGTVLPVGVKTLSILFTPTDMLTYAPVTVTAPLSVIRAAATVTLGAAGTIYDGTPKSVTVSTTPAGLAVSVTYNGGASVPTMAGIYSVVATVTDPNYSGSATGSFTITRGTPVVTWPVPAALTSGSLLSATQLNATASVPGGFVYSPAGGALLTTVGTQALSVLFTPTDAVNFAPVTASVSLPVAAQVTQVITLAPLLPDLVVTAVTASASGTRGKSITVTATVKNQGKGSAAASTLSFYLSIDTVITVTDTLLGDVAIPVLAAGASGKVSAAFVVPSTMAPGSYTIGAIADRTAVVTEANESNNTLAGKKLTIK